MLSKWNGMWLLWRRQHPALLCKVSPHQYPHVHVIEWNGKQCINFFSLVQDSQTTKFTFADGSYGYASTNNYYDTEGNVFNLETGDYTLADGTLGNVFVDNGEVPPATATNTGVINSVSIPSATNTGAANSVSIPSATDTVIINSEPTATGTVDQQTKPSEGSSASLRRGYGDVMIGIAGGLALGIVL